MNDKAPGMKMTSPDGVPLFKDSGAPVDLRVKDLLGRMTLKEKIGQINQRLYGWKAYRRSGDTYELTEEFREEVVSGDGMGALYGLFRADPWTGVTFVNGIAPGHSARVANLVQRYVVENTRLGIPVLLAEECSHGHQALGGTIFPTNLGVGCSWNPDLYRETIACAATEVRSRGAHLGLTAALDMLVDPRWGRAEECYGEDPCLAAHMTAAVTHGLQGLTIDELARHDRVAAVLKHFCAQGACVGGHNAAAAVIGERELREIHLPAFKAGVEAGAQACMAAYNEIDGIPCNGNGKLLTGIIRDEWGFEGVVMGDGYAIDGLTNLTGSFPAAGAMALAAGVDLSLWDKSFASLEEAVRNGLCSMTLIDRAVARVLRLKFLLGLFENPYTDETSATRIVGSARARRLNLELARETLVLLRNENGLLPLDKNMKRIAVIGPNADALYNQLGDYTPPQPEDDGTTILAGIRRLVSPSTEVVYARGCGIRDKDRSGFAAAVAAARSAGIAVMVVGGSSARNFEIKFDANGAAIVGENPPDMDCGEGMDVADLALGGVQEELIKAVVETGVPVVVVLIQGRPHAIPWLAENCPAILCAWYPGQEGGTAVAEALFGDINPGGRLSVSIPRSSAQLPVYYNHKGKSNAAYRDGQGAPLYTFGHGLSYTKFEFSNLRATGSCSMTALARGASIEIMVDVRNTGPRSGAEVVQLYIHDLEASVTRRIKELKAFHKIVLAPDQSVTVSFRLGLNELGVWNADMRHVIEPGHIRCMIGGGTGIACEMTIDIGQ